MNILLNKNLNKRILIFLIFLASLKTLNLIAISFLPKHSIDTLMPKSLDLPYYAVRITKQFKPQEVQQKEEKKVVVEEEAFPITNLVLKAIYGQTNDSKNAFIIVANKKGKDTTLLSIGETIEKYTFSDVNMIDKEAIFTSKNKRYSLQMDVIKPTRKKITSLSGSSIKNSKQNLENYILSVPRNEVLKYKKNFKDIWKNIKIKEVYKNGKINGFRVMSIKSNTIFAKLGLKSGDVIKSINNNKLTSYKDAFKIYNQIESIKNIKITIIRRKEEKELEYEIY